MSDAVKIHGKLSKFKYMSDTGSDVTKGFCPRCGSQIYGSNTRLPDHLTLTLGTMDDASRLDIEVVIFADDKPAWDRQGHAVVSFPAQPDWTPET